MGKVIYHYQRQRYIYPLIKIVKPLNEYFVTKQIINPSSAMADIVKRKEILKKKRCFHCLKAGHLSKQYTSKITLN